MAATVHAPGRVASGAESAGERIGDVAHPVIEVTSLHKAYGATIAVQDVSFTVSEGEIFGILGPNGAGKTTTVECMSGLRVADGGTIGVLGLDPQRDRHAIRELVGVQLQEGSMPSKLTVSELVQLFASFYANPADASGLLELLGLTAKRDDYYKRGRPLAALRRARRPWGCDAHSDRPPADRLGGPTQLRGGAWPGCEAGRSLW